MTFQRDLKRFEGVWIKSTLDSANALGDARRLYWDFDRCPSKAKLLQALKVQEKEGSSPEMRLEYCSNGDDELMLVLSGGM